MYRRRIERCGPATFSFSCVLKTEQKVSYVVNENSFEPEI